MLRNRLLHSVLAVVAIGAWLAYLLACRPSWSPDGSKILFAFAVSGSEKEKRIALYDRKTGNAEILPVPLPKDEAEFIPLVQWAQDGKTGIVSCFYGDKKEGILVVFPVATPKQARTVKLPASPDPLPLPEVAGGLYLCVEKEVDRVDLATGKVEGVLNEAVGALVATKTGVYYLRDKGKTVPGEFEFGTVDLKAKALKPAWSAKQEKVGEFTGFFAVAGDGATVAVVGRHEASPQVFVYLGGKLEKTLSPPSLKDAEIGNLEWSADAKTLYAAVVRPTGKEKSKADYAICAIDLASGEARETLLCRAGLPKTDISSSGVPELATYLFQIALSPDGKTIAASTGLLDQFENESDRALWLVDLATPERKATRVTVPKE